MKRVLIVNAGGRLSLSAEAGSYDQTVENLQRQINGLQRLDGTDEKIATVEVVESVEVAEKQSNTANVIIFVTAGLLDAAQSIKSKHPHLRVIVFTGLIPEVEVIVLSKQWWTLELIRDIITK